MTYLVTNQNNFSHIPYPCADYPAATVKSGGCGPCAVLNCVENMTDLRFKMADWISYVRRNGGRINGGTSITAILKALKRDYAFTYSCTNDLAGVKAHLKNGGMAVFHGGYGNVFSSAGHFLCLAGVTADDKAIVIDSGWYSGKYSGSFRRARVSQTGQNGVLTAKWQYVEADKKFKANQGVNYYLITAPVAKSCGVEANGDGADESKSKREDEDMVYKTIGDVPNEYRKPVEKRLKNGTLTGNGDGDINITESMARIWTVEDRSRYETLDDIPSGEFRDVITALVDKGYIKGDGEGVLDLSQDMVRSYVINYRSGLYR